MKKLLITLAAVFVSTIALAQQTQHINKNYVISTGYQVETQDGETGLSGQALTPDDKTQSIIYYDGLGRPEQTITQQAGGNKEDIISPVVYDQYGRQVKEYLPYSRISSSLDYELPDEMMPALNSQYLAKYLNELNPSIPNPFSEKVLEASPIGRVLEQAAPGQDWAVGSGHTIKFDYQTNTQGEVKQFSVSHPNNDTEQTELLFNGYYQENQLYKSITKDENWISGKDHTTEEFKNKQGQVILKRTYNENEPHDTQYVYDDFGNLTYVIPPTASDEIVNLGSQGFRVASQTNYSWINLVQVDKGFAEDYNKKLSDYTNENILTADIENEYGGQGGFYVTTSATSDYISLSISFSSTNALQLKQGQLLSLKAYGTFKDSEIGRISGADYNYFFYIKNNAIILEGKGEVQTINQSFNNNTKLVYNKDYLWTSYTDVGSRFAASYEKQVAEEAKATNQSILSTNISNIYGGQGGLNISVDENDNVFLAFNSTTTTALNLKQGLVIPLDIKRKLEDREAFDTFSGYTLSIKDNHLHITGKQPVTSIIRNCGTLFAPTSPTVSPEVLQGMCYIYHYDYRNRLTQKKIPGKGWEYIIYDKLDRPVLTQDAKMRLKNEWLFTKYDALNRVLYTGLYNTEYKEGDIILTYNELINLAQIQSDLNENRTTNAISIGDMSLYYSNISFPNSNLEVYTVNYYDDYTPDIYNETSNIGVFPLANQDNEISSNTHTLSTGSKVKILGTNQWIISVKHYDDKARAIYLESVNHYLNTRDIVKSAFDFIGKVLEIETTHEKGGVMITTNDQFTYDHTGRLLTQSQSINGGTAELIANNNYDAHGQLTRKAVGGAVSSTATNSTGLQTVDYAYNIRGWLKTINEGTTASNDLFGFKLNYNTADHTNTTPLYNGNISETHWVTANDNQARSYGYSYDALNRIETADYHGNYLIAGTTTEYEDYDLKRIAYDKNGNITQLIRLGLEVEETHVDVIDDLVYQYAPLSNKLINVKDTATKDGFKDGEEEQEGDDYKYDINGNMISDLNKGITNIKYNHLNLPTEVEFHYNDDGVAGAGVISYIYDATGVKIEKRTQEAALSSGQHTFYAGNYIYEQGSEQSPIALKFFNHPEGYLQPKNESDLSQGFDYVYQFKDHLGNIRLSYADADNNGSIDASSEILSEKNYYPFGLVHRGYNNVISGSDNNYKQYQGQEFTEDLGLNTHEWKYRVSDPAIGRFWQIDPLAESYVYNGTYNFAENRVIDGNELEGLEWVPVNGSGETVEADDYDNIASYQRSGTYTYDGVPSQGSSALSSPTGFIPGEDSVAKGFTYENGVRTTFTTTAEGLPTTITENISDIDTWDGTTDTRIGTLNADFQNVAKEIVLRANDRHGIQLRVTQALRTNDEQNNLYAQGRTQTQLNRVGLNNVTAQPTASRVTNARGGQSLHNYGVAVDVVPMVNGTANWNSTQWNNIGNIGVRAGASWGGNWTNFVDQPHFDTGQTIQQLQNGN